MRNIFQNISLRFRLAILTMLSLIVLSGGLLYLVNRNAGNTITSIKTPLRLIMQKATSATIEILPSMDVKFRNLSLVNHDLSVAEKNRSIDIINQNTDTLSDGLNTSPVEDLSHIDGANTIKATAIENNVSFVLKDTAKDIRQYSYFAYVILILFGGIWVYFWCGKILEPVDRLAEEMKTRTINNLNQPIDNKNTSAEIKKLSNSFNCMMDNLNNSFEIQKRFNSNAAHELRTPIAVLQANIEALEDDDECTLDDYKQFFNIATRTVNRMNLLVENLLQMTQLENINRKDDIDLKELVSQACSDARLFGFKKGVTIDSSLASRDFVLKGNESLFYTAIYNLVENAIKYNIENGYVKVFLSENEGQAEISVSDTGIGISKSELGFIFQPFYRVDKSRSRSYGGAGMGLCLVKNIVEKHGGTVFVSSEEGKGSCFTIKIPLFISESNV